jgi:LmbE family N-acetylglucosaminyl deacetylase
MKQIAFLFFFFIYHTCSAQQWNSAKILHEIKKLQVNASVLYIAAHPDDENTRLLAYLANERMCRTGYLSLTRGDGGQNLIGDEQGVDLGLIRTQELLAARKIDGAEQFFSTAYDFGFSKTSEETFTIWNKEKVLSDAVWVIRKFKPDVIIARFPEDARAGHGHHAASGIIAREAFVAAADKTKFPEQLKMGVQVWQAKRVIWNTFNFGGANTINENQLKIDVGSYNTLLGKSYGEIAAESRSQHRNQGFGVPSQRGSQLEYFTLIAGDSMKTDIMDGVESDITKFALLNKNGYSNNKVDDNSLSQLKRLEAKLKFVLENYNFQNTEKNIPNLVSLFQSIKNTTALTDKSYLLQKLQQVITNCIGLYVEATTTIPYAIQGDSLKINFWVNARLADSILLKNIFYKNTKFNINSTLNKNKNFITSKTILLANDEKLTQPYWLIKEKDKGNFIVEDQSKIGNADGDYEIVQFAFEILGELFIVEKQLQYKHTDAVKGELFQPLYIVPAIDVEVMPSVIVNTKKQSNAYTVNILPKKDFNKASYVGFGNVKLCDTTYLDFKIDSALQKNKILPFSITNHSYMYPVCGGKIDYSFNSIAEKVLANNHLKTIQYDHIPTIAYLQRPTVKFVNENIITSNKKIGYIVGAGDKVPEALLQLGYTVDILTQKEVVFNNIKKYDAIVTGIRAYNTNEWMNAVYDDLMKFIENGGNLIVQYNTSNQIGPIKAKIAPYPFTISRNRITEEDALVNVLDKNEIVLNKPNKIEAKDFNNWVQERSIYEATEVDSHYRKVFTMNDKNEKPTDGSLVIAPYGKGNFIYCSIVLFRELPAGIGGAYKLIANMVELKNK